jgi:hypothetical protein
MRIISVLTVCVLALAMAMPASYAVECDDGCKTLFNGKDLKGWEGDPRLWSVKDGAIVGETTEATKIEANTFLTWTEGQASDFVLKLSYRLRNHNTGIQYRSHKLDGVPYGIGGYQADIADTDWISGICYEEKGRGILAKQGQKVLIKADGEIEVSEQFATDKDLQKSLKVGGWNDYEVIAKGNVAVHKINGTVMSIIVDEQVEKRAAKGLIAFQLHAGPAMKVEFKDIRLKAITAEACDGSGAKSDKKACCAAKGKACKKEDGGSASKGECKKDNASCPKNKGECKKDIASCPKSKGECKKEGGSSSKAACTKEGCTKPGCKGCKKDGGSDSKAACTKEGCTKPGCKGCKKDGGSDSKAACTKESCTKPGCKGCKNKEEGGSKSKKK